MPFLPTNLKRALVRQGLALVAGLTVATGLQAQQIQPTTYLPLDPFPTLNQTQPFGSAFAQALFAEYRALAFEVKSQPSNKQDALYFARKAALSSEDREIMPSIIDGWALDAALSDELQTARRRLNRVLQPKGKGVLPEQAAQLQVLFDCWVEQYELYSAIGQIALCRDRFWQAFSQLQLDLKAQDARLEVGGKQFAPASQVIPFDQVPDALGQAIASNRALQVQLAQPPSDSMNQTLDELLVSLGLSQDRLTLVVNPQLDLQDPNMVLAVSF
mgnify:CR=1 FL=1